MQDDEKEKDEENAKKVHNVLNNIKDDAKPAEKEAEAPAASGPSMTGQE